MTQPVLAMHLCRGNFRSTFAASGDFEPVAEALFAQMQIDACFLEYDDERSGGFAPLRFLPKGKIAVVRQAIAQRFSKALSNK